LTEIPFDLENGKSKQFQSKYPKMRVFTRIWGFLGFFGQKQGFGPIRSPAPRGFYINPSRRGPVPGGEGSSGNPGSREVQRSPSGEWSSAHRAYKDTVDARLLTDVAQFLFSFTLDLH